VRRPIGLAYLLARATDTVADTAIVPMEERLGWLDTLRRRIAGEPSPALDLNSLSSRQATPGEARLLLELPLLLRQLDESPPNDLRHIRDVTLTIISGQTLDLQRFAHATLDDIAALATPAELDDYTYRVAGCVGEFWTRVCTEHLFTPRADALPAILHNSVRFGQGLQLVNILRDLPVDLRTGRCYLPESQLAQAGLKPADLLDPANEPRFRPVYDLWLRTARENLRAGWQYTNALPWRCFRVRLACAWPILIGLDTLEKLRHHSPILGDSRPVKITRPEVRKIMVRSVLAAPCPWAWRRLWGRTFPDTGSPDDRGPMARGLLLS
jgi:farnesyl-diphosphate farnesyltransferase